MRHKRSEALLLDELLRAHDAAGHELALDDDLGDAFLLRENPMYRNVRVRLRALGYRLSAQPPFAAHVLPLLSLHDIYRSRVVPYRANVDALRALERECPRVFDIEALRSAGLEPNPIVHESAHCLARERLRLLESKGRESARRHIALTQLVEAYAQSVELFGAASCTTRLHGCFTTASTATLFRADTSTSSCEPLVIDLGRSDAFAVVWSNT